MALKDSVRIQTNWQDRPRARPAPSRKATAHCTSILPPHSPRPQRLTRPAHSTSSFQKQHRPCTSKVPAANEQWHTHLALFWARLWRPAKVETQVVYLSTLIDILSRLGIRSRSDASITSPSESCLLLAAHRLAYRTHISTGLRRPSSSSTQVLRRISFETMKHFPRAAR